MVFNECMGTLPTTHKHIIDNMQILHECHDSRDDHMQTRTRQRGKEGGDQGFGGVQQSENEIEEIGMTEILEHLSEIDRMSSQKIDAMNEEVRHCLGELEKAGWYDVAQPSSPGCPDAGKCNMKIPDCDTLEDEWRHTYEARKAAWKHEAKQSESVDDTAASVEISCMQDIEMTEGNVPVINSVETAADHDIATFDAIAAMEQHWGQRGTYPGDTLRIH